MKRKQRSRKMRVSITTGSIHPPKIKRLLTSSEEFDVMKLVLDKFLWLGTAFMGFGLYKAIAESVQSGIYFLLTGAVVLVIFSIIIIREFEHLR